MEAPRMLDAALCTAHTSTKTHALSYSAAVTLGCNALQEAAHLTLLTHSIIKNHIQCTVSTALGQVTGACVRVVNIMS